MWWGGVGWGTLALVLGVTLALSVFFVLFCCRVYKAGRVTRTDRTSFFPSVLSVLFYVLVFWLVTGRPYLF